MTVQELFDEAVRSLSAAERLQLASRLLNDVVERGVNYSEEWTDDDLAEFTAAGWQRINQQLDREEPEDAISR